MQNPTLQQSPESVYRQQLIIWLAMLFSMGMYFVVIRVVPSQVETDNPTLVNTLLVVAVSSVVASFLLKSSFLERARQANKPALGQAGYILALVLCESAALYSIVIWFVTGSPRCYWFLVIGFAGTALHYPHREE